jgi:transcriptional/translational regulatory protein YebC/TACO1
VRPHFDRIHARAKATTAKKHDLQTQVARHLEKLAKQALKDPDLALRLNALLSEADVLEFGEGKKKRRMEA